MVQQAKTVGHSRWACAAIVTLALSSSGGVVVPQSAGTPDAHHILDAHLSHGIGKSPFDSDVWKDQLNATLILGARSGATVADLQRLSGHREDLSERLATLERAGFLRHDAGRLQAAFPIIIDQKQHAYSAIVSQLAGRIEKEMRADWQTLLHDLSARGWTAWAYHFVWSQTMDSGFAWAALMKSGRVPPLSKLVVLTLSAG
jgi:hypothetical protein